MATNLSDIGFPAQTPAEMEELARHCFKHGKVLKCSQGTYRHWDVGNGVELFAQLNGRDELIGLNPHFYGKTRMSAGLMERVTRAGFPMDGGFRAFAQPYGAEVIQGSFQFVFDCPEFLIHEELKLPLIRSAQMTAFAQQCAVFKNEEVFRARLAATKNPAARNKSIETFLPIGMFGEDQKPLAEPLASALLCAQVTDVSKAVNPATRCPFWWLKIRALGNELDFVADAELLPENVEAGNILQSSVWLSGRI